MVAETHRHHENLTLYEIAAYAIFDVAQLPDHVDLSTVTVGDCGFSGDFACEDLAAEIAEEYGERTLGSTADDEDYLDTKTRVVDLVARFYPNVEMGEPTL